MIHQLKKVLDFLEIQLALLKLIKNKSKNNLYQEKNQEKIENTLKFKIDQNIALKY
jgi:hypothetical protein